MHTYVRLFFNLLLPLTLLFTAASIGYFTLDYSFSKAFQLGILFGVFIGIGISLVMAFVLLMLRKVQKNEKIQTTETVPKHQIAQPKSKPKQENSFSKEIKCMLLMDKELTFDVLVNALKNEGGYTLSKSDPQKGIMTIQTKEGIIQTTITSLTQHTSQIILLTQNNTKQVKNIISHIKEKEHSFLQY